jgi:hypothetical protein
MLSQLRASVASLVRNYSSGTKQVSVCIVGSGPAGFYTAHQVRAVLLLVLVLVLLLGRQRLTFRAGAGLAAAEALWR